MIYELKRYTAHPGKSKALSERFIAHTIPIFNRLGMQVVGAFAVSDDSEDLCYMLAFEDGAARDKAWAAFGADAQWKEVKAHSELDGPLLASQQTTLLTALVAPVLPQGRYDPASFPRTPSHAARRLRSFVTGARNPMAVCMRTRL